MLTEVKTNKFGDVTCTKYKLVMPRLTIDGVRAAPEQVKVVPPKDKKKRAPPSTLENEEKCQWPLLLCCKIRSGPSPSIPMLGSIESIKSTSIVGT